MRMLKIKMAEKSANTRRLQNSAVGNGAPTSSGPTVQGARSFTRRQENLIEKNRDDLAVIKQAGLSGNERQGAATMFPSRFVPHDRYDNVVQLKATVDDNVLGKKTLTTDDLEWLQRKKEALNAAQYKQYAGQVFDLTNPAEAKILRKIHPEYYDEKEEIIDQRKEMLKTLAKIRVRGFPENQEELELMFAIGSGNIEVPVGVLWDPLTWNKMQTNTTEAMNRGLFNPTKLFAGVTSSKQSDLVGERGGTKVGPFARGGEMMTKAAINSLLSNVNPLSGYFN